MATSTSHHPAGPIQSEWVICRIFNKSFSGKKTPLTGLLRISSLKDEFDSSPMPPLMDSPYNNMVTSSESAHVAYFSNGMGGQKIHGDMIDTFAPSSSFFTNTSDVPFSTLLRHKTSVPTPKPRELVLLHFCFHARPCRFEGFA